MATRQQIERAIVPKLVDKNRGELDFDKILAAFTAANPGEQQQLVGAVRRGDIQRIGNSVINLLNDLLKDEASAQASAILADDAMSLDEIDAVFGPFQ